MELPDEKTPENSSLAEEEQILKKEGQRIIKAIKKDALVIALAIKGNMFSSEQFAAQIEKDTTQ